MPTVKLVLLLLALICFGLAALNVEWPRSNFVAAGLFCALLAWIITLQ